MFLETDHFCTSFLLPEEAQVDALKKMRQKLWDRFLQIGLPDSKNEAFEYLNLKPLTTLPFQKAAPTDVSKEKLYASLFPECRKSFLVFVNGTFRPDLSTLPKECHVSTLGQAMRSFSALLNNCFNKTLKEDLDSFSLLNAAVHQEGAFLYLPPKTVLREPLQILSLIDCPNTGFWIMPRLHLFLGASSELTLVHRTVSLSGQNYLYNGAIDIQLEENAKLHYTLSDLGLESSNSWVFDSCRAHLKSHATFKGYQLTNAEKSRRNWQLTLAGDGAEVDLQGMWLLDSQKEAHAHVVVEHQAPHCRSMQRFKSVLSDSSRSSFQGKIVVQQKAIKTEAYQLNNNLMLSDQAQANSKPNLEIFADDVKASHGATVGQLDTDALFYLKTRGFSESQAKKFLIQGFCRDVIDGLCIPSQASQLGALLAK